MQIGLYRHRCKTCGKDFEGRCEWAYKVETSKGKKAYHWFCSYKCKRQYEKKHTKIKKPTEAQQRILDLLDKGIPPTETGRMLGISYSAVAKVRDKWR